MSSALFFQTHLARFLIKRADQNRPFPLRQSLTESHRRTSEHGIEKSSIASTGANGPFPISGPVRWQRSRRRSFRRGPYSGACTLLLTLGATNLRAINLLKVSLGLSISTSSNRRPGHPVFPGFSAALDRAISRLAVVLCDGISGCGSPVGHVHHVQYRVEAREVSNERTRWIDPGYHVSLFSRVNF